MVRIIFRLVKCETRLARKHRHVFLLRRKLPGKLLAPVCVEVHFDALCPFDGYEALGLESPSADNGCSSEPGCRTEHTVQRYGSVRCADSKDYLRIAGSRYVLLRSVKRSGGLLLLRCT